MVDTDIVSLVEHTSAFFAALGTAPKAGVPIAPYPLDLLISTPDGQVAIEFRDGGPGAPTDVVDGFVGGYWTLEVRGARGTIESIFAGAITMGEAMYAGLLVAPEEKAKHNLVCALGLTILLVQEEHRRARDPQRSRT